jgi:hypothetical protein
VGAAGGSAAGGGEGGEGSGRPAKDGTVHWRPPKPARDGGAPGGAGAEEGGAPPARSAPAAGNDSRGRALQGRYELTVYEPLAADKLEEICSAYGLREDFPRQLIFTRTDGGKHVTMVSADVASIIVPQQKLPTGEGRVKVVNTGLKILSEVKGDARRKREEGEAAAAAEGAEEEGAAAAAAAAGTASAASASSRPMTYSCSYRLLQAGVSFLLPYMARQVVHVSGAELVTVLKFKGQFVPKTVYSPRLQLALENFACGSLLLVLNPALGGLEGRGYAAVTGEAPPAPAAQPEAGAAAAAAAVGPSAQQVAAAQLAVASQSNGTHPPLSAAVALAEDGACSPLARVPLASEGAIAPALRPHYALSPEGTHLVFQPSFRVCAGLDPMAKAYLCLWKGSQRFNLMVDTDEAKGLSIILEGCGFR